MRVTVGTCVMLGLAAAVAGAQPPRERAATLKPPQAIGPTDAPPVARGVSDDFPAASALPSTPVPRPFTPGNPAARPQPAGGPAWLNGVDPHVTPAAGLGARPGAVQPLGAPGALAAHPPAPPVGGSKPEPSFIMKGVEKLKSFGSGGDRNVLPPGPPPVGVNP